MPNCSQCGGHINILDWFSSGTYCCECKRKNVVENKQLDPRVEEAIDKYLKTVCPAFLIDPIAQEFLLKMILMKTRGIKVSLVGQEKLIQYILKYFNEELVPFLGVLENKGIDIKYKENAFVDKFVEKITQVNYDNCSRKYDFEKCQTIDEAIFRYIDLIIEEDLFNDDNLGFISLYLSKMGLTSETYSLQKTYALIEARLGAYKAQRKVKNMEDRIENPNAKIIVSIDLVDSLSGIEFEGFLCCLFQKLGYSAQVTKASQDQGVDLILTKNNEITVVQAKCYSSSIGNEAIQQVVAGAQHYKADKAMVVTNNYFTSSAKELAQSTRTILWDRDKLEDMIKLVF